MQFGDKFTRVVRVFLSLVARISYAGFGWAVISDQDLYHHERDVPTTAEARA